MLAAGRTGTVQIGADGSRCGAPLTLLVESSVPAPRMLVFGAIDFAAALVRAGRFLGYDVTVCDARPVFATERRFPEADEVVVDWPHRYLDAQQAAGRLDGRTAICVLTHDAKFDVPLLERALRLPVGYVGAMGSRRTHLQRLDRLRESGLGERALGRLHSPIGLDLGARTPRGDGAVDRGGDRRGAVRGVGGAAHRGGYADSPGPGGRRGAGPRGGGGTAVGPAPRGTCRTAHRTAHRTALPGACLSPRPPRPPRPPPSRTGTVRDAAYRGPRDHRADRPAHPQPDPAGPPTPGGARGHGST